MKEKDFLLQVMRYVYSLAGKGYPIYGYKIPDHPSFKGVPEARFSLQKPFDLILFYGGQAFAIEAKLCKKPSLGFSSIEDHQREALQLVTNAGNQAFYLVCFMLDKNKSRLEEIRKAFLVPFGIAEAYMQDAGRNSFPYKWFLENGTPVERVKVGNEWGWKLIEFEEGEC